MKITSFLLVVVYSLAISVIVVFGYDKYKVKQIQKLYTIDSQLIVDQKKIELKDMIFKQGQQPTEDAIVEYLTNIDKIVEYVSERDNAVVIIKSAIASKNAKDITAEVLEIYAKQTNNKRVN